MLDEFNQIPGSVEFALMAMAAWRVAVFLVLEGGAFGVTRWLRGRFGIDHDQDGSPLPYNGSGLGALFSCVWCMSFWQAIIAFVLWVYAPYVIVVGSIWGGACIIDSILGRIHRDP